MCFFFRSPRAVELVGRTDPGGVARAIGHRGKEAGLVYCDDLRNCGGSPRGRNVPC